MEAREGGRPAAEGSRERYERRLETVREAIELAEGCVRALEAGPAPDVAALSNALAQRALPHVESDAELWAATQRAPDGLAGQRARLAGLLEELDLIGRHLERFRGGAAVRRRLQQCLGDLVGLLRHHLEEDLAIREVLRDGQLPASALDAVLDRTGAAERASAESLRFVWQSPLPATEATALRSNPAARRVRVLTGCGPVALVTGSGLAAGCDGRHTRRVCAEEVSGDRRAR